MKKTILFLLMTLLVSMSSQAQTTIFDVSSGPGSPNPGTLDPFWTVDVPGGGTNFWQAKISNGSIGVNNPYAQDNCGSWITPYLDINTGNVAGGSSIPVGTYRFQYTFELSQCAVNSAVLDISKLAADNYVSGIYVNGSYLGNPATTWGSFNSFNAALTNLVSGTNVLEIRVYNQSSWIAMQVCGTIEVDQNENCCEDLDLGSGFPLCTGNSATLDFTGQISNINGVTWSLGGSALSTPPLSESLVISAPGSYSVLVTTTEGCTYTSSVTVQGTSTTDILSIETCLADPCLVPGVSSPFYVVDNQGNALSNPAYSFVWSNGFTGSIQSLTSSDLPISVTVTNAATGCIHIVTYECPGCYLSAPIDRVCVPVPGEGMWLAWSTMAGANSYEVEIFYNDPACCDGSGGAQSTVVHDVNNTLFYINDPDACFSWRVRAICDNEEPGAWSGSLCSCDATAQTCDISIPTNLGCDNGEGVQFLNWNNVSGAVNYEIEITHNDPNCCAGGVVSTSTYTTTLSSYIENDLTACFSWRVRAFCANGEATDWSAPVCSCPVESNVCDLDIPKYLNCANDEGVQFLTWNSIAGAANYEIEITYNDPLCCQSGGTVTVFSTNTGLLPSYSVNSLTACFSWRVRAYCANGLAAPWSGSICSCSPYDQKTAGSRDPKMHEIDIMPNPFNNLLTFDFKKIVEESVVNIKIVDNSGKPKYEETIKGGTQHTVSTGEWVSGAYYCQILVDGVEYKEMVIKKAE